MSGAKVNYQVKQTKEEVTDLLSPGRFTLQKWATILVKIIDNIPSSGRETLINWKTRISLRR